MKKIVSVLSVAALALSAVFAADVSLKYNMKGTLYEETNKKTVAAGGAETLEQTRSIFNQTGYAAAKSDLVITAKNDYVGFVLDIDPNASAGKALEACDLDEYYGWMNIGNVQLTTGKWTSRYAYRFKDDAGEWEDADFERYKLGVIGGKYAYDADNLTGVYTQGTTTNVTNSKYFFKNEVTQQLSTALAYTLRPNDDTYFMIKGVLVDSKWGSTFRGDSDRKYDGYGIGGSDISFFSGFAGEVAFKNSAFDVNVIAKSLVRDQIVLGAYLRPILSEKSSFLVGFTYGKDLKDQKDDYDRNYGEMGIDLRGHFQLNDVFCLTTMNNLSILMNETKKGKEDLNDAHLWNMVSLGYKASEKVLLQLTVENEGDLFHNKMDGNDKETDNFRDLGGFTISVIPGVTYSFNANATLTAGLRMEWAEIGATSDYKSSAHTTTTTFQVPVVFAVKL